MPVTPGAAGGRPPFVSGELLRGIAAARTEVLRAYAESRGRVLSGMVRSAMASPDCTEEPSAPRLYAEVIAKELASPEVAEVKQMWDKMNIGDVNLMGTIRLLDGLELEGFTVGENEGSDLAK